MSDGKHQRLDRIFLDMDGVLTDFVSATLRLHGRPNALENWPTGEREIHKVLDMSRTQYWNAIDAQGADFWASLDPFPWFADLVALVREFAPMTILTSPSLAPSCAEGKVRWLYANFAREKGRLFTDYLIGSQKHWTRDSVSSNLEREFRDRGSTWLCSIGITRALPSCLSGNVRMASKPSEVDKKACTPGPPCVGKEHLLWRLVLGSEPGRF